MAAGGADAAAGSAGSGMLFNLQVGQARDAVVAVGQIIPGIHKLPLRKSSAGTSGATALTKQPEAQEDGERPPSEISWE